MRVLAGLLCELDPHPDYPRRLVQLALRTSVASRLPDGSRPLDDDLLLPPASLGYQPLELCDFSDIEFLKPEG
jgi:hypothetical protein